MRTVYTIVVFWPFLCFQPFSLEILSHFDLKTLFSISKTGRVKLFSLYLCTEQPTNPFLALWDHHLTSENCIFNFISRLNSCVYHINCTGIIFKVEIYHQLKLNRSLKFEENPSSVKIESIIKVWGKSVSIRYKGNKENLSKYKNINHQGCKISI